MLKRQLFNFIITVFAASFSQAADLTFLKNGADLKVLSIEELKRNQTPQSINVFEPLESKKKIYQGFSVLPLLKFVYSETELQKFDTVVFYCEDGYRSDVPLEEFNKKKSHLSFAMSDGSFFQLNSKEKKSLPLGPYYLTWDHPDAASALKEFFRWPYGINKIDVIKKSQVYSVIEPAKDSPPLIKAGHAQFLKHCFSCHQLNNVGGLRGPPLNLFVSVRSQEDLVGYILNPKLKNKNSQMAGLPKDLKGRNDIAEAIVNYLKRVSKNP